MATTLVIPMAAALSVPERQRSWAFEMMMGEMLVTIVTPFALAVITVLVGRAIRNPG
jgi:hypothetical protein